MLFYPVSSYSFHHSHHFLLFEQIILNDEAFEYDHSHLLIKGMRLTFLSLSYQNNIKNAHYAEGCLVRHSCAHLPGLMDNKNARPPLAKSPFDRLDNRCERCDFQCAFNKQMKLQSL